MNVTVLLGAPGSGKGTQAKRLAQSAGFQHFSTGDMLRAAITSGSEVGSKAKGFIDRGELVPDPIMIELIERALSVLPSDSKVILDGFPRTVPQAEALDAKPLTAVKRAVFFRVPESLLVKRLTGRRICEKCGEPFHMVFLPPKETGICDRCGGKLIQRSDDSESVVRRRLEVFAEQNDKLVAYYQSKRKFQEIDGDVPVGQLQDTLAHLLA